MSTGLSNCTGCGADHVVTICVWIANDGAAFVLRLAYSLFFFSSRRRHTRLQGDWSSDVCSSDLTARTYQLEGLCRNALVYEYHIQETQGDFAGALSTLKALNIMRLKSMAISPYLEKSRFTAMDEARDRKSVV